MSQLIDILRNPPWRDCSQSVIAFWGSANRQIKQAGVSRRGGGRWFPVANSSVSNPTAKHSPLRETLAEGLRHPLPPTPNGLDATSVSPAPTGESDPTRDGRAGALQHRPFRHLHEVHGRGDWQRPGPYNIYIYIYIYIYILYIYIYIYMYIYIYIPRGPSVLILRTGSYVVSVF